MVRSDADAAYVQTLADYVTDRVQEVKINAKQAPQHSLTILAALNIADELFKERRKRQILKEKLKEKSKVALALIEKEVKTRQQETI